MQQAQEPITSVTIPGLMLKNPTNEREHWSKFASRSHAHRAQTAMHVRLRLQRQTLVRDAVAEALRDAGLYVLIVRYGARMLDTGDNLPASCKHVRDGIADVLRTDDADPAISWAYDQEAGEPAAKIEIYRRARCECCGAFTVAKRNA